MIPDMEGSEVNKRIAALAVTCVLILGGGVAVAQAASRPPRGNCAQVGTNIVKNVALTSDKKCPKGYWGPVANGANGAPGVKGDKGETGAQGPQGLPGKDGKDGKDGVLCIEGYATKDIVVANVSDGAAEQAALTKAQEALADAKAVQTAKETAAADSADKVVAAQAGVYAAKTTAELALAQAALDAAVKAKDAADAAVVEAKKAVAEKQAAVDAAQAAIATAKTFTIRTCVKAAS